MATEFPDDPEVDLGFRDPATEKSVPKDAEEWKARMDLPVLSEPRISKPRPRLRLNDRWWSLRATIVIFLSAFGGLISSIFLFERAQRPNVLSHWKRQVYTASMTTEALPTITNSDLSLDQIPSFRIGGDRSTVGDRPLQGSDELAYSVQQSPPFNAAVRLPLSAPPSVPFGDFSMNTASETVVPENVASENATQTKRTVRAATEKMRKRQIARFRRRAAKRVVRSAKSIASFWAFWSRHFLGSGLASTSSGRRKLAARKSPRRRIKGSPSFPLSWHAARSVKTSNSPK
jgi:hypothetical protein